MIEFMNDNDEQAQMAQDIREIKQAVIGDRSIGLNGLVNDMQEMKQFRAGILLKVSFVAGAVAVVVVVSKPIIEKLVNTM